jgi:hypothetical protein
MKMSNTILEPLVVAHPVILSQDLLILANYDMVKSPIAVPGSTNTVESQGTIDLAPTASKQDLQALATGQNTLQNVIGAVGQAWCLQPQVS